MSVRYIVISPVRNEERHIERTIDSVCAQSIKPIRWIIVDDGSSDGTPAIISERAKSHDWIVLLRRPDRGFYDLDGGGEIKAFLNGYECVKGWDYDYLVKLDGDVSFNEAYFEDLFNEFGANPKLGIASGGCYHLIANRLVLEKSYKCHPRGAGRVYRRRCWEEIEGVVESVGWDAMDVYKARMLGWEACHFEAIRIIHHVRTGSKDGLVHDLRRGGRISYLIGCHPIFFLLVGLKRMFMAPFVAGGLAYLWGYLGASVKNEERIVDLNLMNFIRKEQVGRIKRALSFRVR